MYRLGYLLKSHAFRPQNRRPIHSRALAAATLALGVSTTVYYAKGPRLRRIYGDSDDIEEETDDAGTPSVSWSGNTISDFVASVFERNIVSSISPGPGIARYDSQVISSHGEDRMISAYYHYPDRIWSIFSIFDGHNGDDTSMFLIDNLSDAIIGALADLFESTKDLIHDDYAWSEASSSSPDPSAKDIDDSIKQTFNRVDDDLVHWGAERVLAHKHIDDTSLDMMRPAESRSSALLVIYDSLTRLVRVANTGDSRAILCRASSPATVEVLSTAHTIQNPAEVQRVTKEHPGETVIAKQPDGGSSFFGSQVTRTFGNAAYKWSRDVQNKLFVKRLADPAPEDLKSPPYFTAEPDVSSTRVEPGDIMIIGSAGLWKCLTDEEAMGLVKLWLQKNPASTWKTGSQINTSTSDGGEGRRVGSESDHDIAPADLPLARSGRRSMDNTVMYKRWGNIPKRFINYDSNMADHLARNALGGADGALTYRLLKMEMPRAGVWRDDISIGVLIFDAT